MIKELSPCVRIKVTSAGDHQKVSIQLRKRWFWSNIKTRWFYKDVRCQAVSTMTREAVKLGLVSDWNLFNRELSKVRILGL